MKYLRAIGFSFSTIFIYLGISLLGWGTDDLSGFFSLLPRGGYAAILISFGLALGYQAIDAPEGISGSKGEPGKLIKRQTLISIFMTLLLFGMLFLLPWADRHSFGTMSDNSTIRWLGLLLSGAGYILIFWSGVALGKMYSAEVTVQKNHQIVSSGLYRYIRHPRYLGLILAGLGMSGLFRSWLGLAGFAALVWILLLRIKDEEGLMRQELGETWRAYCEHSWRLIPYIF